MEGKTYIGYVPQLYHDDGTNVWWEDLINDNECFATEEECEDWCDENDIEEGTFLITKISFTDEDEMTYL